MKILDLHFSEDLNCDQSLYGGRKFTASLKEGVKSLIRPVLNFVYDNIEDGVDNQFPALLDRSFGSARQTIIAHSKISVKFKY